MAWNREPFEPRRVRMAPAATARRLLATPAQRSLLVAHARFVVAVVTCLPELPVESGLSEGLAAATSALLFVVGLCVEPTAGESSDRFPRPAVSIAMLGCPGAGILAPLQFDGLLAVGLGTVATAAGSKTRFTITDAVIVEAAPEENVGGDLGAARAGLLTANPLGPGFVGVVAADASDAAALWALVAGLRLSASILGLEGRRS
jgi:hypothetical protein